MIDEFQGAAEAVGATVKRFVSVADAALYIRDLAGTTPVSSSSLPPEIKDALAVTAFAAPAEYADAQLCVSFARAGIARTGSLILELDNPVARSATALPLIHAVLLRESTIVPDLYDAQGLLAQALSSPTAYLSITTGPSRTADIERVLTIGVHGPKELHVLVLEGE